MIRNTHVFPPLKQFDQTSDSVNVFSEQTEFNCEAMEIKRGRWRTSRACACAVKIVCSKFQACINSKGNKTQIVFSYDVCGLNFYSPDVKVYLLNIFSILQNVLFRFNR